MAQRSPPLPRTRIVDATIALAEEIGWDNVRLHLVAERLDRPLADLQAQFRDLDAIANAWFEQPLRAVVAVPADEVLGRPPPERLELVMMRWFDALAAHRRLTRDMLAGKLYFSHPHHWVPLIFDLSRLIHWFLDAARIRSTGRARQLAETGLTLIFLATLRTWLRDESPDQARTRAGLRRRLELADRWLARLA